MSPLINKSYDWFLHRLSLSKLFFYKTSPSWFLQRSAFKTISLWNNFYDRFLQRRACSFNNQVQWMVLVHTYTFKTIYFNKQALNGSCKDMLFQNYLLPKKYYERFLQRSALSKLSLLTNNALWMVLFQNYPFNNKVLWKVLAKTCSFKTIPFTNKSQWMVITKKCSFQTSSCVKVQKLHECSTFWRLTEDFMKFYLTQHNWFLPSQQLAVRFFFIVISKNAW